VLNQKRIKRVRERQEGEDGKTVFEVDSDIISGGTDDGELGRIVGVYADDQQIWLEWKDLALNSDPLLVKRIPGDRRIN
jgi:hypothetical protein